MSDSKKAQLEQAKATAKAQAAAGHPPQVADNGPLGLPSTVSIVGVPVPSLAIVGVAAILVLIGIALVVHHVRSK